MNEKEKIQIVINTLKEIMIPASFDNINRMMGIYQTLIEVRDAKEVNEDGV